MPTSKAQQKANRKWNENNLDRLYIFVPKGQKEIIKMIAESKNISINKYITNAIAEYAAKDNIQL